MTLRYIASFYIRRQATPDGDSERNIRVKAFNKDATILEIVCWYDSFAIAMSKSDLTISKELNPN